MKDQIPLTIKFPAALVQQLDEFLLVLTAENPGVRYTRADVVRLLISRALVAELKTRKEKPQ